MSDRAHDQRWRQRTILTAALVATDAVAVALALIVAFAAATASPVGRVPASFPLSMLLTIPVAIALFAIGKLYVLDELLEGSIEYGRVVNGCTLASLSLVMLAFGAKSGEIAPSRILIALLWVASILTVGSGRFLARRVVRFLRRRGVLVSRAVIVGLGTTGLAFARQFEQVPNAGIKVIGFVDDYLPAGTPVTDELKVLGPPSALPAILKATDAQEVIIVPTAMAWESFQGLIRQVTGMNGHVIRLAPGSPDLLTTSMKTSQVGFIPMTTVERVRIVGLDRVIKTMLDYGIASLALLVAAPLVVLTAAIVRSRGYRTPFRRVQYLGREAGVFTTMVFDPSGAPSWIVSLVRFFGLERGPQLLSVLRGHMSIVGPRPIPPDMQRSRTAWLHALLAVKPGITGFWELRKASSLEQEMEQSLFYIRNYTIWLDLEVLVRGGFRRLAVRPGPTGAGNAEQEAAFSERVAVHR